ncbi:carbohydrate-binding protein [Altericista sp. CCNU0014]|uniref:carbohydrate-binding protein n=1 Tax=Altericista sp. CCNU0014 TaxID=3082949 RepID=UPI00384E36AF
MNPCFPATIFCGLTFALVACTSPGNSTAQTPLASDLSVAPTPIAAAPVKRSPSKPAAPQANLLGINVDSPTDYSGTRMFADAIKQSREWRIPNTETLAPVDANGWPLRDAQLTVWHGIARMNGRYRLSFTGRADAKVGCCSGTIQNQVYSPSTNTTTADLIYPATDGAGLFLEFNNTKRTATSPSGSGITNVKLMRPITEGGTETYPPSTLFTTHYKESLKRFQVLRFMDFLATNSNGQKRWSERLTPSWYSMHQSKAGYGWQGRGGAYEYAIALCNELSADCWLTVPAQADDDYVRQLAALVKAQLNPKLKLYVEYSNELWNFAPAFQQANHNLALAKTEVAAGSPLNFDGEKNSGYWAWRRVAKRGAEISSIFRQIFGDAAMMTRVRPLLMAQLGFTDGPLFQAIYFLQNYSNNPALVSAPKPPKYYFYGLGGSAYYNPKTPSSPDAVFADLSNQAEWVKALRQDANYAAAFGLKRIAYEGGPSLEGGSITDQNRPTYRNDPRIKSAMVQAHDVWSANGGDLLAYFTLTGESPWGFVPDIWDITNPQKNLKFQAMDALNTRPRAKVTYGVALPTVLEAAQYDAPPKSLNYRPDRLQPGQWLSYTVRVDRAGDFKIELKGNAADANSKVEIWVDGTLVGVVSLPKSGWIPSAGKTPDVRVSLGEGLHGIMIRSKAGTINASQIIVKQ